MCLRAAFRTESSWVRSRSSVPHSRSVAAQCHVSDSIGVVFQLVTSLHCDLNSNLRIVQASCFVGFLCLHMRFGLRANASPDRLASDAEILDEHALIRPFCRIGRRCDGAGLIMRRGPIGVASVSPIVLSRVMFVVPSSRLRSAKLLLCFAPVLVARAWNS